MQQGTGIFTALAAAAVLSVAGCATPIAAGDAPAGSDEPQPVSVPADEVIGQGTVLQMDGGPVQFCLGAVAESYPPQCSGPPITGWDWDATEMWETASGVTWGTYAVQGEWDGSGLTVIQPPIPLALYDPMATIDPRLSPDNAGTAGEAELARVQETLPSLAVTGELGSWIENGYLFVQVVHDDGAIQAFLDSRFGPNVAVVQSALRLVG